jgi:AraC-like DNA-binding protein
LIDVSLLEIKEKSVGAKFIYDFYMIALKDKSCGADYGRNSYDFDEGVLAFTAPGQVYTPTKVVKQGDMAGWMLFFHPDLIRSTHLGSHIAKYSFFDYDVFEALHLSENEEDTINDCIAHIQTEYHQRIDDHSQNVIVSNIELLLNYCLRFYDRQFNTRSSQNKDVVAQFEKALKAYFKSDLNLKNGLPAIQYFARKTHLSQHYFSDLIKKETGRTPTDHINGYAVEKAKYLLLGTEHAISEIAYDLGFNYAHYFSRVFKSKTGQTPSEYRSLN